MQVIHHREPALDKPAFICDGMLHPKLADNPMLRLMNKSFTSLFIGRAGSGKTSLLTSLVSTKTKKGSRYKLSFRKCFDKIFLFMPKTSISSMKNCPFADVPDDQQFETVTVEALESVYAQLLEMKEEGKRALIIMDDCQSQLKLYEVEQRLLHIIANRRHLGASLMIVAQNYNRIPKNIRITATDVFIFNPSPPELEAMGREIIEVSKKQFEGVMQYYRRKRKEDEHSFLYIHDKATFFVNHDEVVFKEEP